MRFIKKYRYLMLLVIFFVGVFLRFYNLDTNPPSINWDEASTGYNAYSILKTGRDEYGNFLPLSIRSFDDYKPPVYTYLTVPFVLFFGLSEFSVRLPSAILGSLTILVIYFLVLEIIFFRKNEKYDSLRNYSYEIALTSSFLFSVSPWSLQFSRAAYEGNIGLFFYAAGLLFFLKSIRSAIFILLSTLFFILGLYSYHSFRLLIPLTICLSVIFFYKEILHFKKIAIFAFLVLIISCIPIYFSFLKSAQGTGSRLSMVTIFNEPSYLEKSIKRLEYDKSVNNYFAQIFDNRRFVFGYVFVKNYLEHFNPNFLYTEGDSGRQHHAVDMGMLFVFLMPFMILGVYILLRNIDKKIFLIFLIFLLTPLPSAIATGAPHAVRAISMSIFFDFFTAVGLISFAVFILNLKFKKLDKVLKYSIFILCIFLFSFNLLYYLSQYYFHTPREYGDFWQYGYKEALLFAKQNENKFRKIIFTYKYDQPYIYYLFYNKINPAWYQKEWNFTNNGILPRFERVIGKYEFKNITDEDKKKENVLLIGTPDEISKKETIKEIKFLDGKTAFRISKK